MQLEQEFERRLEQRGITRRSFLKYCTVIAGALGLGPAFGPKIYQAFAASPRPSVLWLHFAECTGCTEAVLRTSSPGFADLIFDVISLDYHETVMAAAGAQAKEALQSAAAANSGQFFCVVEGAIPTAAGGVYGMIGGRTMLSIAQDVCPQAQAVISIGTCASFGGISAAAPNPTGAKGVKDALGSQLSVPVINISGCPPNPVNFVATIATYLPTARRCTAGVPTVSRKAAVSRTKAARDPAAATTALRLNSTTGPAGRFRPGTPVSAAANPTSGTP